MSYDPQPKASHFVDGAFLEDTEGTAIPVIYPLPRGLKSRGFTAPRTKWLKQL